MQFKAMVESNNLFEWSSEVALGLSSKFCNWVVEEEPQAEDDVTTIGGGNNRYSMINSGEQMPSFINGIGQSKKDYT